MRFYGNACEHFTVLNTTAQTRVSLDVRVARVVDYAAGDSHPNFQPGRMYRFVPFLAARPGEDAPSEGPKSEDALKVVVLDGGALQRNGYGASASGEEETQEVIEDTGKRVTTRRRL